MKILLRPHLKIRLREREIPEDYPTKIILQSELGFYDTLRNHKLAIRKLKYYGKLRPMVTVYDIIEGEIQIITVYTASYKEIDNRLKSGRWIIHPSRGGKDEKN